MSNISLILSYNSILFLSHSFNKSGSDCVCLSLFTSKRETYWEMFSVAPFSSICLLETTLANPSMSLYSLYALKILSICCGSSVLHTAYQQAGLHGGVVEKVGAQTDDTVDAVALYHLATHLALGITEQDAMRP